MNNFCSLKPKNRKTDILKLNVNGNETTNKVNICNALNTYFCNIGQDLVNKLQQTNENNRTNNFADYFPCSQKQSTVCKPVDAYELEKIIIGLNCSKSAGYDNIGPKLVKSIFTSNITTITFYIQLVIFIRCISRCLKIAKVVPIYKKDDPQSPCSYRPISLLSIFGKILEKLMQNRLSAYLEKFSVLYDYQFGFRKFHSTSLALIEVIDCIYRHLDHHEKL